MEKALVTGGSGFVGSHLVDLLVSRRRTVRCLMRKTSSRKYLAEHTDLEFVEGGLDSATDWDQVLEGVDTVYHVAGLTFARRRQDYFTANHRGTEAILSACVKRRDKIRRFVYISSLAAVGPGVEGKPVNENTTPHPITPYGQSKLAGEEAVRAAADLLNITIIRPPAVYGPRDYAVFEFFKAIKSGVMPMIGGLGKLISLVHVRDLVEGIRVASESHTAIGRTYFIANEMPYSMTSVIELLAKVIGKKPRIIPVPRPLAYAVGLAAEGVAALVGRPPVVSRDKVTDFSQACWACAIDAAQKDLSFVQRVPLGDGFRETFDWYRKEGWL